MTSKRQIGRARVFPLQNDGHITIVGLLFNSNSSSFTRNLCGFPNGVFVRIRLTRRGSVSAMKVFNFTQSLFLLLTLLWG